MIFLEVVCPKEMLLPSKAIPSIISITPVGTVDYCAL